MAKIILVTGGTRSGKSDYALRRAEENGAPGCFIATCSVSDQEMTERIRKHRLQRKSSRWTTIEEPLHLVEHLLSGTDCRIWLVDCLTLWVSNMMFEAAERTALFTEEAIEQRARKLLDACGRLQGTVIMVTSEVGMGIVPENQAARRYRDLLGRCNRVIAEQADEVVFVSCGLPLHLKQQPEIP